MEQIVAKTKSTVDDTMQINSDKNPQKLQIYHRYVSQQNSISDISIPRHTCMKHDVYKPRQHSGLNKNSSSQPHSDVQKAVYGLDRSAETTAAMAPSINSLKQSSRRAGRAAPCRA